MKTNSPARSLKRLKVTLLTVAVVAIAALDFRVSESMASRFGQVGVWQSGSPPVPNVSISDFIAAAR